jgi:hypothetical protein
MILVVVAAVLTLQGLTVFQPLVVLVVLVCHRLLTAHLLHEVAVAGVTVLVLTVLAAQAEVATLVVATAQNIPAVAAAVEVRPVSEATAVPAL